MLRERESLMASVRRLWRAELNQCALTSSMRTTVRASSRNVTTMRHRSTSVIEHCPWRAPLRGSNRNAAIL